MSLMCIYFQNKNICPLFSRPVSELRVWSYDNAKHVKGTKSTVEQKLDEGMIEWQGAHS